MEMHARKLVVIYCEAALETALIDDVESLGAHGHTIVDARGSGRRGRRAAHWEADRSIRMEIICDSDTADAIVSHVHQRYFNDYAMSLFTADIGVLRPDKF